MCIYPWTIYFSSSMETEASERCLLASWSPSCKETQGSSQSLRSEDRFWETARSRVLFWWEGEQLKKLGMNWCSTLGAMFIPGSRWNSVSRSGRSLAEEGSTSIGICWIWKPNGSDFSSLFSFGSVVSGGEESPTIDPIMVADTVVCSCTAAAYSNK